MKRKKELAAAARRNAVKVGVAAVIHGDQTLYLMGLRKGAHGAGYWSFPGGKLDYGEDILACAERETLEETGLEVRGQRVLTATAYTDPETKIHWITVFVLCRLEAFVDEVPVMEPNKCERWRWCIYLAEPTWQLIPPHELPIKQRL